MAKKTIETNYQFIKKSKAKAIDCITELVLAVAASAGNFDPNEADYIQAKDLVEGFLSDECEFHDTKLN